MLNILAPLSWAKVSSTVRRGCTTHCTFPFNGFRSTQIHIVPVFYSTTTIPVHQGVGYSTFEITCIDSILSNSCFTLVHRGMGTCHGVKIASSVAPSFSLIVYSSPKLPKPWKSDRNLSITLQFAELLIDSTVTARFKDLIEGNPSKFHFKWATTYIDCMVSLPSHSSSPGIVRWLSTEYVKVHTMPFEILIGGFPSFGM